MLTVQDLCASAAKRSLSLFVVLARFCCIDIAYILPNVILYISYGQLVTVLAVLYYMFGANLESYSLLSKTEFAVMSFLFLEEDKIYSNKLSGITSSWFLTVLVKESFKL